MEDKIHNTLLQNIDQEHRDSSSPNTAFPTSFMKMEPISTKGELMICRSPIDMKDDPNFIPTPQQQKRRTTSSAGEFLPKLESDPMEIIGSVHPNTIQSDSRLSASTSVLLPSAIPASSSNDSSNNNIATSSTTSYLLLSSNRFQSNTSTIRQLPVLRSFMFVLSRILHFPKSVFTKGASAGRSYLQRLGIAHSTRIYYGSNTYNRAQSSSALRNHRRSMSESDSNSRQEAVQGRWRHHQFRSRSRSRSPTRLPNSRTNPIPTSLSSSLNSKGRYRDRLSKLLNSYKVQIAMVCVCLTGEAFVQSVMSPFLYYLVRDFRMGSDIWIGYYTGLLWTGYWSANLATILFWGHLSDKYGRKVVLLFGLVMTSISTIYLGLSSCYHDAMLAMVIQGACNGLVPVSKCAIGEIANRQQHLHDAELVMDKHLEEQEELYREKQQQQKTSFPENILDEISDADYEKLETVHEEQHDHDSGYSRNSTSNTKVDIAAKGYSALVIAIALGAALGPLVGGSLTKKQLTGFEPYPYFAPCLVASLVCLFVTSIVALILNESHPKWIKPTERELYLKSSPIINNGGGIASTHGRSSSVHEVNRCFRTLDHERHRTIDAHEIQDSQCEIESESVMEISGARSRVRQQESIGPTIAPISTIRTYIFSPATELYFTLMIYSLLVLISILGNEFVMLYTQSPILRGGLGFSAKDFGQALTMRGILKLIFNLFGYPLMVNRYGLQKCLKMGISLIGIFSVFGLGIFVPWNIKTARECQDSENLVPLGMDVIIICLSIISIGDVLGYVSVLVLFGRAADRLKGAKKAHDFSSAVTADKSSTSSHGGSGVLWSLAQVSANVMRLAAPVIAGLLWSLTEKSGENQSANYDQSLISAELSKPIGYLTPDKLQQQQRQQQNQQQQQQQQQETFREFNDINVNQFTFWLSKAEIIIGKGSTRVFFLVGAICIINLMACRYLSKYSSSVATTITEKKPSELLGTRMSTSSAAMSSR